MHRDSEGNEVTGVNEYAELESSGSNKTSDSGWVHSDLYGDLDRRAVIESSFPTDEIVEANRDRLDNVALDRMLNPRDYQPEAHLRKGVIRLGEYLREGLGDFGEALGKGFAWAGFWIGLGLSVSTFLPYLLKDIATAVAK